MPASQSAVARPERPRRGRGEGAPPPGRCHPTEHIGHCGTRIRIDGTHKGSSKSRGEQTTSSTPAVGSVCGGRRSPTRSDNEMIDLASTVDIPRNKSQSSDSLCRATVIWSSAATPAACWASRYSACGSTTGARPLSSRTSWYCVSRFPSCHPESWPCYLLIALIRQAGHTSIAATLRKIKNTPTPTAHQTI